MQYEYNDITLCLHRPIAQLILTMTIRNPKNMKVRNAQNANRCLPAMHLPKKPQWWSRSCTHTSHSSQWVISPVLGLLQGWHQYRLCYSNYPSGMERGSMMPGFKNWVSRNDMFMQRSKPTSMRVNIILSFSIPAPLFPIAPLCGEEKSVAPTNNPITNPNITLITPRQAMLLQQLVFFINHGGLSVFRQQRGEQVFSEQQQEEEGIGF